MVEEKIEPREINFRQWLPWTQIFRGFWVALDHKKLLLAAAGILVMSLGWWFLASTFYYIRASRPEKVPEWGGGRYSTWDDFKKDRTRWNLFYEAAGPGDDRFAYYDENDLANSQEEYDALVKAFSEEKAKNPNETEAEIRDRAVQRLYPADASKRLMADSARKPFGRLRTLPWFEDRGPNQFLLVTAHASPWRQ